MKYLNEMGAIIGSNNQILRLIKGNPGSVDFPAPLIWQFHQQTPGCIFSLAHTHPSGFDELSKTDKKMFEAWGWALYPWPIRMHVITQVGNYFVSKCFLGQLESKEDWLANGKIGKRNFSIIQETEYAGLNSENVEPWAQLLINESYKM